MQLKIILETVLDKQLYSLFLALNVKLILVLQRLILNLLLPLLIRQLFH
jgi:hypothetical protein